MKKSYKIYVISGASGSGKSSLLQALSETSSIKLKIAPKYSTRNKRDGFDDIIHDKKINKKKYDIVYTLNNRRYGFKINELQAILENGNNLGVVLSEKRVVEALKEYFGDKLVSIYLASSLDSEKLQTIQNIRNQQELELSIESNPKLRTIYNRLISAGKLERWDLVIQNMAELTSVWKSILPDSESTEIRSIKLRDFHKSYLDNIHFFDRVILNYDWGNFDSVVKQGVRIIENTFKSKEKKFPPIFIISAASGSGKAELMETVRDVVGNKEIVITSKIGNRKLKKGDIKDGQIKDGMIPLKDFNNLDNSMIPKWWNEEMKLKANQGEFPDEYDIKWVFHKGTNFKGVEYGVSSREIDENLRNNKPQIFISNFQQTKKFKERYGQHCVFLYLYRLTAMKSIREYQFSKHTDKKEAEQRISEISKVFEDYIQNINEVDHVILNTSFLEDMFNQIFNLIKHYQ